MRKLFLIVLLFMTVLCLNVKLFAQNCTVNAGVNQSVCASGTLSLGGSNAGLFASGASGVPTWSQTSGPSVSITNPTSLTSGITGFTGGNSYVFMLSATCADGSYIFDTVKVTIKPITIANAGIAQTLCPGTNVSRMSANTPGTGETGAWSVQGTNYGVTVSTTSSATSYLTLSTGSAGAQTERWTITNTNGCSSYSDVVITNRGGVSTVSAGTNQTLQGCYSYTQSATLAGSYAGNGTGGQGGLWTVITGPNVPTFSNSTSNTSTVSNLITGTYKFRWTVSGNCVSGSSDVQITVPVPSGTITSANASNQVFCDLRTTAELAGNLPTYAGETVTWSKTAGSGTITNANMPNASVTGLTPGSTSTFLYTITNSITNCTSSKSITISYVTAPSITLTSAQNMILPVDATTATITYNSNGGNAIQYAQISTPSGAVASPSYAGAGNSSQAITGLTSVGKYVYRFIRNTSSGVGGCAEVLVDVNIYVSKTPTAANAGTKQTLACNVTSTALAGNIPAIGTGKWYQVSGPNTAAIANPLLNTSGISGLTNGKYTFRWSITCGVNSPTNYADVNVIVAKTTPTTANAGTNQTVCYNTPVQLQGNATQLNETGTWTVSPSAGVSFNNVNSPIAIVTGMSASTAYTFTWTIFNACSSNSSSVVLTTTGIQGPVQANAGVDQCKASGTTAITLAGNNPNGLGTGTWTKLSGPACTITNSSLYNSTVTGMTNGTYYFGWAINYNGCSGSIPDTMVVTISAATTTAIAGSTQTICGNSTTLAANTASVGTGSWTQISGPNLATITNSASPISTVMGLVDGTYDLRWTISNNACSSSSSDVLLNVGTAPSTANAGANQNICPPATTATLAGNTITVGSGVWSVVSGPNNPTFSNITSPTSTVSGMQMGTYTFRWSSQNGPFCPVTTSDMQLTYAVSATALTTQNLCNQPSTTLAGQPTTSIGTWTWVSGPNTPTITNNGGSIANVDGMINGTYTFQYTINNGICAASSKTITVNNFAQPTAANAGGDQQACNAATISLVANTPTVGTGKWSQTSGTTGTFGNVNNATTTFTGTGSSILRWTVTNGTGCISADEIRVDNYALPTTANAGNTQNICGYNTALTGNAPVNGVGSWSLISKPSGAIDPTITAPISPTSSISFTNTGTYTLGWTISNGTCTPSTSNVNIVINGNPPTTTVAGVPQSLCNVTSANLAGNTITTGIGTWSQVSGPNTAAIANVNSSTSNISGLIPGVYDFRWTASNGSCPTAFDDVLITIYAPPTTSNAGNDQTVCNYTSINLAANTPTNGTGVWSQLSGPNTATIGNTASPASSILGTIVGSYQFVWTITSAGGCTPSVDTVKITINDLPSISVPGASQDVCNLTSINLAGNTPSIGTGTWTLVSGPNTPTFTSPNSANSKVTNLLNGTYIFRWTIANGSCISSNTTQVQNDAAATVANAGVTQSFCSLTSTIMAANTATSGTGVWTKVSGSGSPVITTPSSPTTTITGLSTGTYVYKWTITNGACTSNNNVTISNFANPTVTAGGGAICFGLSKNITASGASTYAWSNSLGSGNTKTVNPTITTTYSVTGTDVNGCSNTSNAIVTVNSLPVVTAIGGTLKCSGTSLSISASGANSYSWNNSLGSGSTKSVSPLISTTYTVTGTDGNGCSNTANAIVNVTPQPNAGFSIEQKSDSIFVHDTIVFHPTQESISSNFTFNWDFGDGSTSNLVSPMHSYMYGNSYTVKLTVSNSCGTDSSSKFITAFYHPNSANLHFTNVKGPWTSDLTDSWSAAWMDYNNDNWEDVFVTDKSGTKSGIIYKNNGDGTFSKATAGAITSDQSICVSSVWADINNDGYMDAVLMNDTRKPNYVYMNNGSGSFTSMSNTGLSDSIGYYHSGTLVDYDNDGRLDFFTANYMPTRFNELFHQEANNKFTRLPFNTFNDVSDRAIGVSWVDYNNDGLIDVFIPQGDQHNNRLFKNLGNGNFEEVKNDPVVSEGGNSVGSCWGDYDNDGYMDLFVSNASNSTCFLYHNNGDGTFTKITNSPVVEDKGNAYSCNWVDVNNDGYLDLYVSCDGEKQRLYINDGHGQFTRFADDICLANLGKCYSNAWADYDKDGALDLFIATRGNEKNYLLKNNGNNNNWTNIKLVGVISNRSAIGARVRIKSGGMWQTSQVVTQSGFGTQNSLRQHFGLGSAANIDSIIINWPSGIIQKLANVNPNQFMTIVEATSTLVTGKIYIDENGNCQYNRPIVSGGSETPLSSPSTITETTLSNAKIKILPGPIYTSTNIDGVYNVNLAPGEYTINIDDNANWQNVCGDQTFTITPFQQTVDSIFIPVQPKRSGCDLAINVAATPFRRGFKGTISISCENKGTTESDNVSLTISNPASQDVYFEKANLQWSNIVDQDYIWSLGSIKPGQTKIITLTDSTGLQNSIGAALSFGFNLSSAYCNDLDTSNNKYLLTEKVVGAIDPNEITVTPEGKGVKGYISKKDTLIYTIYFQNAGNYTAKNIYIEDKLPYGLDITSFMLKTSSHPCTYELSQDGTIKLSFNNINLLDSLKNEALSHGLAKFSVMPKWDIPNGTELINFAQIKFDYEDNMSTNKVLNTIQAFDKSSLQLIIYPIPAKSLCTLLIPDKNITQYKVFDINGNLVMFTDEINQHSVNIDISKMSRGIYNVVAKDKLGTEYKNKLIIE